MNARNLCVFSSDGVFGRHRLKVAEFGLALTDEWRENRMTAVHCCIVGGAVSQAPRAGPVGLSSEVSRTARLELGKENCANDFAAEPTLYFSVWEHYT
jgi:hypothetical protein